MKAYEFKITVASEKNTANFASKIRQAVIDACENYAIEVCDKHGQIELEIQQKKLINKEGD